MKKSEDTKFIPVTSVSSGKGREITPDVFYYTDQIVNIIFIGAKNSEQWVLIDSGMPGSRKEIVEVANERYGKGSKPQAILLTHGHFDHVGNVIELAEEWGATVYAHPLEFPYLTGKRDYPKPDSTVEGGLLAKMAFIYPHKAIDISEALVSLPADNSVPYLEEWKWVFTPGHSPGHVSFFRAKDRVLIAGDAFVTVRQDSLYKVLIQKEEVNGPPRYLTTDWDAAKISVVKLAALSPEIVIAGHGTAMGGDELKEGLKKLVEEFDTVAVPSHGKYVQ